MKAIAKLFMLSAVCFVAQPSSARAGLDWLTHGAGLAQWTTAQQEPATESERRQASDQWVQRARKALSEGNLDLAEDYVSRAEKIGAKYDSLMSRLSDSPAKVRRDLAEARQTTKPNGAPSQKFTPGRLDMSTATQPAATPRAARHLSDSAVESLTDDAKARAAKSLESGRLALRQGNLNEAIAWQQKAVASGVTFAAGEYSPSDLARELQQAGVDPNRLARQTSSASITDRSAPSNLERLPTIGATRAPNGLPNATNSAIPLSGAKDEAVRLAARARAAMDRGDLAEARQLAQQAEALRVPESAFGPQDLRPWEVSLQVESRINRRQGVVQAGNFEPVAPGPGAGGSFPVAQGLYEPSRDATRNVQAQSQLPLAIPGQEPTPAIGEPRALPANPDSPGVKLFQQGMEALAAGDRAGAVSAFRDAWKYEQQLTPDVRQQLKDKLFVLTQNPSDAQRTPEEPSPLEEVDSQQQLVYQKLYREIATEEQTAEKMTRDDPKGALQRMMTLRDRVSQADVDAAAKKQLLTFVDRSIGRLENYIEQNKGSIELDERNRRIQNEVEQGRMKRYEIDDTIATKVEDFNRLMEEERFAEAEVIAKQVRELAPDNPIAQTLLLNSKIRHRLIEQGQIKDMKEQSFYEQLTSVERSSINPLGEDKFMEFGDLKRWQDMSRTRGDWLRENQQRMSPTEMQIRDALKKQVEVQFEDQPLRQVLETLGGLTGINVFVDSSGLAAEGVTSDTPVSLKLSQPVSLQSALNLILQQHRLGYVIRNDVLHVTSEQAKDSNTYHKTYYVADLIVPIPNFVPTHNMGLPSAIREAHQALGFGGMLQPVSTAASAPLAFSQNDAATPAGVLGQMGSYGANALKGSRPTSPNGQFPGSMGGAALADFDTLIQLITQTIAPDTWVDAGGPGAIEPFPTNLSLVISQTQDVHDQIADLLEQLRRLQDLQVAIEVRFITLRDNFFERIGIDFDFQIDDNVTQLRRDDQGPSMAIGLDNAGNPTLDLDIPFDQDSFSVGVPPFGGFSPTNAATMGVAILSDIEAFFIVQAATGDRRSNVLTAPKVTLFNGQAASVNDTSQRPFVIGLVPVVGDFAVAHQPVVTVLNEGTQLGVQAVVSSDRRFVRLTLVPFFSQIGDVEEFTFSGSTSTDTGTNVVDPDGEPTGKTNNQKTTRTGTTIQLPTFSFTTVSTTVSVPDGGTVLLGGIKRLSEGRNEFGVPGLNKIPYVNRLFKNVGIGRETSSLMLMVTPRIIIQEEEENKLGLNLGP